MPPNEAVLFLLVNTSENKCITGFEGCNSTEVYRSVWFPFGGEILRKQGCILKFAGGWWWRNKILNDNDRIRSRARRVSRANELCFRTLVVGWNVTRCEQVVRPTDFVGAALVV